MEYTIKKIQIESKAYNENIIIYGNIYEPTSNIKGIVQVVHGMAEHRTRYNDFASFLASNGYVCVIYDQRGHGETAGSVEKQGYMSDYDNFNALLLDVKQINDYIRSLYPNFGVYLFGHSMGSFISQRYIELYPNTIKGVMLCGTNYTNALLFKVGAIIAKIIVKIKGRKNVSKMLINMSFGSYNKTFKPNRTEYDWLSANTENVDKYINDPYCGADFSSSYFKDLIVGFNKIAKNYKNIPTNLPIYLLSGACDPVGAMGKGVTKLYNKYLNLKIEDVSIKLYEGKRHEILNEDNKEEVYNNILIWLNKH